MAEAQTVTQDERSDQVQINTITTAVPFLKIATNPVQLGMGQLAVVSSNFYTENAFIANAALLANGHRYVEVHTNYTPWLRALVPDINLLNISAASGITENHAVGLRYTFFSLGKITFTDNVGNVIGNFTPHEHVVQLNYAGRFNNGLSLGMGLKYIYSNLTGGISVGGASPRPGQAAAADFGLNYRGMLTKNEVVNFSYSLGFGLNNIGSKMSYTQNNEEDFIPMDMQIGAMFTFGFKAGPVRLEHDLGYQIEKLLVPTPPVYDREPYIFNGLDTVPNPNYGRIIAGKDPNVSVPTAIFQSFDDAPGGSQEEWYEVNHMIGHEFRVVIKEKVSIHAREGFFYEHVTKGNRQFFTLGAGVGFYGFRLDFSYLIPTQQNHPLANTVGVGLTYRRRLGKVKEKARFATFNPMEEQLEIMENKLDESSEQNSKK